MIMEMKMKRLIAIVAVAASLASPALAQSWDPDVGSGNIAPPPYGLRQSGSGTYENDHAGFAARAKAPRHFTTHHRVHMKQRRPVQA
jgi:hypothetical protein